MNEKQLLHAQCISIIADRISNAERALGSAHESMLGETKSSAGDKFETSRAMLQGEQDRMKGMLIKNKEMAYNLSKIPLDNHSIIQSGSLVETDTQSYFIAIGLGKVIQHSKTYYVISLASPLGQLLKNKQAGTEVILNGKSIKITNVE